MDKSSYTHKEYGKIFTPVMNIESYKTLDELTDMLSTMDGIESEEKFGKPSVSQTDPKADAEEVAKAEAEAGAKARAEAELKAKAGATKTEDNAEEGEEKTPRRQRRSRRS